MYKFHNQVLTKIVTMFIIIICFIFLTAQLTYARNRKYSGLGIMFNKTLEDNFYIYGDLIIYSTANVTIAEGVSIYVMGNIEIDGNLKNYGYVGSDKITISEYGTFDNYNITQINNCGVEIKNYENAVIKDDFIMPVIDDKYDGRLSDIRINGVTIEGFNMDKFDYDIILPYGTKDVDIEWDFNIEGARTKSYYSYHDSHDLKYYFIYTIKPPNDQTPFIYTIKYRIQEKIDYSSIDYTLDNGEKLSSFYFPEDYNEGILANVNVRNIFTEDLDVTFFIILKDNNENIINILMDKQYNLSVGEDQLLEIYIEPDDVKKCAKIQPYIWKGLDKLEPLSLKYRELKRDVY